MLFVSGKSPHLDLTHRVYEFFTDSYEITSDVEVYHTDLSDDNAVGFTEVNGEEQFVQIDKNLTKKDFIITLFHELVHVKQNEMGMNDDEEREQQAYNLELDLYSKFIQS